MIRDRHAREDLFQETALALWRDIGRYDPSRPFGAWARGVAAHKVLQGWAKARRVPVTLTPEAIQAVGEACERVECDAGVEQEALRKCLDELSGKSRHLLELRYEKSLQLDEMARLLESTLGAVHKSLSRIRQHLQRCVEFRLAALRRGE
jgi:RNA polymerase sigma-70 factor (ECF subfamily)